MNWQVNWQVWGRVIAIAVGTAVLIGLRQGLGQELYVAIPAGAMAYFVLRGAFAFMADTPAK